MVLCNANMLFHNNSVRNGVGMISFCLFTMEENRARFGSNCKMLAYQAQSLEFKTWVSPKKKKS
jgi:hypothetical protein